MIKTANLTANTETSISGLGGAHCRINNNTAGTLYASAKSGIVAGGDDVTAIPAGRGDYVVGTQGTVYLLSASGGSVQVEGTDVLNRPFDNAAVTGGVAVGNSVVMDGLQGGVPFSEMVVSGKNLIPYPYDRTSGVYNGLTVDISDDGKFSINGTATADTTIFVFAKQNNPIYLSGGVSYTLNCSQQYNIDSFNIFFKIYHADRTYSGYTKYPASFTAKNGDYLVGSLWIKSGSVVNAENVEIQLELGDTATEYEPPITGRELTIHACGKNLIPYPYHTPSGHTNNGVTFTINDDRTITANGTATAQADYYIKTNLPIRKGRYMLSGCPEGGMIDNKVYYTIQAFGDTLYVSGSGILDTGDGAEIDATEDFIIKRIMIRIAKDTVCDNVIFRPQLETGNIATDFEPYSGSTYTITPDSNPYTVPDDIRQQDGLNVVTASEGELSVTGVRKNAAIKKIWDKLDELTTAVIVSTADLSE